MQNQLPIPETHEWTGPVQPNNPRNRERNAKNANSFVLRVQALLCEVVWVDRPSLLESFRNGEYQYFT